MVQLLKKLISKKQADISNNQNKIYITKYWHSFILINFFDKTLLFDPFFGNNTPVNFEFLEKADITKEEIPKLDAIFITHEHFDHFDKDAVEFLARRDSCPVVAPALVINQVNIENAQKRIIKIDDKIKVANIDVTVVPAQHPQAQYSVGFVLKNREKDIYFAGDTYDQNLDTKVDIAIVPCGGVFTMDLFEFVAFARKTEPKIAIPMHYNTFSLIKTNIDKLKERASEKLKNTKLIVLENNKKTEIKI
jgi:L-ascorbate metabolism protein UlaG (beta-lactamase superfamily)